MNLSMIADLPTELCPKNTILYLISHNLVLSSNIDIMMNDSVNVINIKMEQLINYYSINIILKKMIRQHFFPKNHVIKIGKKDQRHITYSQNQHKSVEKTQVSQNYIILDPQITQPIKQQQINSRRHHSVLRPMQSVALQAKPKSKRKIDQKDFLIDSRRKQICTPVKREFSMVQQTKPRKFSDIENVDTFDLGLHNIFRTKQTKRRQRMPISMRLKAPSPLQFRPFQMKVKGWQTNIDDFIDFL